MLIVGEPSGDLLAAELVGALRAEALRRQTQPATDLQPLWAGLAPRFFGAGGPRMAGAGVELACELTRHAVVGLAEVFKNYRQFRRLFRQLLDLAVARQPEAVVLVDFSGFNRRFAAALRRRVRARRGTFNNWRPRLIQYVSPQVWASRAGRVRSMARDLDLLLSIFPFEKDWYALRAPRLRVEFVGHPMADRFGPPPFGGKAQGAAGETQGAEARAPASSAAVREALPLVLLLPGSRPAELERHLPLLLESARRLQAGRALEFRLVLPTEALADQARRLAPEGSVPNLRLQIGGLAESLRRADLALASTGTVTLECAWFGVPTVAFYKTGWLNYQVGRRLVRVAFLAMPNLLAGEAVFPEFIQRAATPEALVREARDLLDNPARRQWVKERLARIVATLGGPGASQRAARAILDLLEQPAAEAAPG